MTFVVTVTGCKLRPIFLVKCPFESWKSTAYETY